MYAYRKNQYIDWEYIWNGDTLHREGSIAKLMLWMLLDIVVYIMLAMWLEQVVIHSKGFYRPFYFFLQPKYYYKKAARINQSSMKEMRRVKIEHSAYENVSAVKAGRESVQIRQLTKEYTTGGVTTTALNDLSIDIYKDEITAILGQNGSGKTSLLNIILGIVKKTQGKVRVCGFDVDDSNDVTSIHRISGFCPQHDALYNDLTVTEHFEYYSALVVSGVTLLKATLKVTTILCCFRELREKKFQGMLQSW